MDLRRHLLGMFLPFLLLGACSSPRGLDRKPAPLSDAEKASVGAQVEKARDAGEWTRAWNQAIEAGAGRDRLEAIALDALEAGDGVAEDMLEALLGKWGGLTPAGRERVGRHVSALTEERDDWGRAVAVEILAADDAPTYAAAWRLYERAPVRRAETVLEAILEARGAGSGAD